MEPRKRRNTTYSSPIGSVDLPWHAEIHIDDGGEVFVREWHAVECEEFEELIKRADDPADG